MSKVRIDLYKWEGKFFPFEIKTHCGECTLNNGIIESVILELQKEGIEIEFNVNPWLNNWYKLIFKKAYHAPIVLINGKLLKQEKVVTREELKDAVYREFVKDYKIPNGIHVFSKPGCKYCKLAKALLKDKKIKFIEHDIINSSLNMQKMLSLVIGKVHPITTPQIFIDGKWIGGYDNLVEYFKKN